MHERMAEDIAEDFLHVTGLALRDGDYSSLGDTFELPQKMETLDGTRLITTEGELCRVFDRVRQYFAANNVTDVVRTVVSAEFLTPDVIGTTHVSQLMRPGGELFRAPYPVYSLLHRLEDGWRIVSTTYAILDDPEHNKALTAGAVHLRPSKTP